jgi:Uma2 family endonuclease
METVTIAEAWPHYGQEFTIEDLDKMPDDGHRYELLDGTLIVSPAPGLPHQRVVAALIAVLESACPDDPDLDRPTLRAFELSQGTYTEVAHVAGDQAFHAQRPFRAEVVPGRLVAKLRRAN